MAAVYRAPPGGLYVVNPRTIFDIVARSLAIHCFAVCAYAQLTSLLSWTTHRRLTTVQITLFMLFPELAILQALFYVSLILITGRGRPDQFAHNHSADLAENNWKQRLRDNYGPDTSNIAKSTHRIVTETDGEKQFEDPSKRAFPWTLHLLFVITTCGPLIVTVLAYKQRLAIKYMAADYVGNLGLDHRNAWVSIGGIVAASGSIALLFLKRTSMSEVPFLKASIPNLELESLAPDIMLYQAGMCSMMHHVLLAVTNHITPFSYIRYLGNGPLLIVLCVGVLIYWRRPKWRSVCEMAVKFLATLLVATTASTQLFCDIRELLDVSAGHVQPYNYRWKVKDWGSSRSTAR